MSGKGRPAEMRGLIAYQEKLNALATKSSGWSENVKLIKFAIRLKKHSKKGTFVDHTCLGTTYSMMR